VGYLKDIKFSRELMTGLTNDDENETDEGEVEDFVEGEVEDFVEGEDNDHGDEHFDNGGATLDQPPDLNEDEAIELAIALVGWPRRPASGIYDGAGEASDT
jgi:hypothetical protein